MGNRSFYANNRVSPFLYWIILVTKQECIPVGCVPSTAVAVSGGICPRGGVSAQGCLPEGVCPVGCLPRGCVPRGMYTFQRGQTDTYKDITFLQLLLRMVMKNIGLRKSKCLLCSCATLCWHLSRIFTARKRSLGQGNMFTGMCLATGGSTPQDQVHPPGQVHPLGPGTPPSGTRYPPDQVPPRTRYTPWDQAPPGSRPPGADTSRDQVPQYQVPPTPQDQVHPWDQVLPGQGTPPQNQVLPGIRYSPTRPGTPPLLPPARYTSPPGRYGQRTGGTHPTGMQSCFSISLCVQKKQNKTKQNKNNQ